MSEQKLGYLTNTLLFATTLLSGLGSTYFATSLPGNDRTIIGGGMFGVICVSTLIANLVDLSGFEFKEKNDLNDSVSNLNLSGYPLKEL